ncbi:MAG: DUF6323 family protein [Terrisporobacter othiniensis]|uniref:Uncharacterized protein n=1 Tax=Terrisporobacter othiniensis TaxID=1577792 RepID=A0A0B3VLX3_9FIRM|nr:DUF6323 family protein [Terrisporobacter othiniensis]KHS57761.1 hypothetical protein QX51_06240 [Terrisporobacter othiniensis]MDU6983248.1 DUF6323 family protein [Terrisporobacter othiniensis]
MIKLTKNIILSSLQDKSMNIVKNEILKINEESSVYGLILTSENVEEIIKSRGYSLKTYGRIDLNMDATKKIINKIYISQYTDKDDYVEIINDLQDIFYYLKNETLDKISDNEIIDIIGEFYEETSGRIDNVQNLAEKYALDFRLGRMGEDE